MTSGPYEIDRRTFLESCTTLALCVAGWPARLQLRRQTPDVGTAYRAVLSALVRTILPFEHPAFPRVTPEQVETRLLALFPLEEERYAAVRQALLLFDEVALFPTLQPAVVAEETEAMGAVAGPVADRGRRDKRLYEQFVATATPADARSFTELAPASRLEFVRLWGRSEFTAKRRFYRSAKRLVMATAYSMEEFWRAIGYGGPLLGKRP